MQEVELFPENYNEKLRNTPSETKLQTKFELKINRIVENEGFIKYKINKRCISTNGGNYLGELYEIDVKGTTKTGEEELNLFIKNIIKGDTIKVVSLSDIYKTELFVYKELSKIFEELQKEANVPLKERYKMVKVYEETDKDTIILENITRKGFTTYHRTDVVSLKFLEMCVENLARFHGMSFVLKQRNPEFFNMKLKSLNEAHIFGEDFSQMMKCVCDSIVKIADEDLKKKIEKLYGNVMGRLAEYYNDETIKVCLCHGDYRPNNIMMKIENDEVTDIIPIDYQLNHYGCPVFDLLYLIYVSTEQDFRKAHMLNLKNLYYDTLHAFLKYFDLDARKIYPRKEFERVYKEKLDYGLLVSLHILPFLFVSEDDVPDLGQSLNLCFQLKDTLKERLRGVLEEFTEWGYI